jgi:hypothetical protein
MMNGMAKHLAAVSILIAVVAIFIAPAFDLPPTALRAARAAQQILMGFAFLAATASAALLCSPVLSVLLRAIPKPLKLASPSVIDLNCSRLC